MWIMEDFGTTKLLIGFSISRITNKMWPDIDYIWFCSTDTIPFILATLNIISLVEIIEEDVFKLIRICKIALVERNGVWMLDKHNFIRGSFKNLKSAVLPRRNPHWASK